MNNPFLETLVVTKVYAQPWVNNLRTRRKELNWTQASLAKRMSTTKTTISNWESGRSTPALPTFYTLCRMIRLSPNQLLGWTDE